MKWTCYFQIVEVMKDEHEKWAWLKHRLVEFTSSGSVLIFVTRKVNSEEVATSLRGEGHKGGWSSVISSNVSIR